MRLISFWTDVILEEIMFYILREKMRRSSMAKTKEGKDPGALVEVAESIYAGIIAVFICVILVIVVIDYVTQLKKVFRNKK